MFFRRCRFVGVIKIPDISRRMLAQTLRYLEEDGCVKRTVFPTVLPKVNYEMTPLGRSLLGRMKPLMEWAEAHHSEIKSARKKYVAPEARKAL
jgi:DNA-binding HxlR family transcriptional regulator